MVHVISALPHAPPQDLPPGLVLDGRYALEAPIGRGAMGVVYSAQHLALGHLVAVKILDQRLLAGRAPAETGPRGLLDVAPSAGWAADSTTPAARFRREALVCARLGDLSRHIVRVVDFGLYDEGRPYLVMELLRGEALSARITRAGPMSLREGAGVVVQLARALAAAHREGIVHRDLKPANVFLATSAEDDPYLVKLVDFGVAKVLEDLNDGSTKSGTALGTPAYMAPEQLQGARQITPACDLWALGVLFFRIVTGDAPFGGGAFAEVGGRILWGKHEALTAHCSAATPALDSWLDRALAKVPEARFADAETMSQALLDALEGKAPRDDATDSVVVSLPLGAAPAFAMERQEATTVVPGKPRRFTRAVALLALVALTVLVVVGAGVAFALGSASPKTATLGIAPASPESPEGAGQRNTPESSEPTDPSPAQTVPTGAPSAKTTGSAQPSSTPARVPTSSPPVAPAVAGPRPKSASAPLPAKKDSATANTETDTTWSKLDTM